MALTQDCISDWVAHFACKIAVLSDKYETALSIGSECTDEYLFHLQLAIIFNEILCSINLEEESCLTEEQICELIDKLKYTLKNPCNCH